jgi:hypothetical protein
VSEPAFPFGEAELVAATGLGVERFRAARKKLARGLDWEAVGRKTAYSVAGFYAVLLALGLARKNGGGGIEGLDGVDLLVLQKNGLARPGEPLPAPQAARVERFCINRLMMQVRLADGRAAFVRTRRAEEREMFRRGMAVPIRAVAGQPYYELARAAPRRPGKW